MHKTKLIVILIFPFIILSFTSCYVECPAFPEGLISYFPYSEGQEIKFKNEKNDTLINIVSTYSTSEESQNHIFSKNNCYGLLVFTMEKNNNLMLIGEIMTDDNNAALHLNYGTDILIKEINGVNPNLKKNNLIFGDTLNLTIENPSRISSVTIVRGKGIVEFTDIEQNCTWKLIE